MSNRNSNVMQQPTIFGALRLTIFFVAAGLTSASVSKLGTLSVEKIDMSNNGTLLYGTLSFPEKLSLFKQFESNCKREVTNCDHLSVYPSISCPSCVIIHTPLQNPAVSLHCRRAKEIPYISAVLVEH